MKKILLQINSYINFGSTGKIVEEIGRLAIKNGWESYIAFGRKDRKSASKKIKIGDNFSIAKSLLKTRIFDKHGFSAKKETEILIKKIEEIKPTIIHLHNLHGYYINIEILFNYLNKSSIPILWTLHDCWSFTGHCAYFDFVSCEKWKTTCSKCPQKFSYPSSYLFDRSELNYNIKKKLFTTNSNIMLVPVSHWLDKLLEESFFRNISTQVIHNGIDLEIFKPSIQNNIKQKYRLGNKFLILGVASVWNRRKGLAEFIKLNDLLDERYKIILIGLSQKQIKNLPKNIVGISHTENVSELVQFYSNADVFINPTFEDNYPTTNLEAIACGTPVITYKTGGSVESISQNTGLVVEKGNIQALFKAVEIIYSKGKEFYHNSCIEYAKANFDKNKAFQKYLKLYKSLLN